MSKLDFSEFHPLDHHILDPVCWGWAGGIPRHISLWWDYQFSWPWQPIFAKRACDKGLHEVTVFWRSMPAVWVDGKWVDQPADGLQCVNCDWVR